MTSILAPAPELRVIKVRRDNGNTGPCYNYVIGSEKNVFATLVTGPEGCNDWLCSRGIHSIPTEMSQCDADTFEEADAVIRGWYATWWASLFEGASR